jgi:hypothetical protein
MHLPLLHRTSKPPSEPPTKAPRATPGLCLPLPTPEEEAKTRTWRYLTCTRRAAPVQVPLLLNPEPRSPADMTPAPARITKAHSPTRTMSGPINLSNRVISCLTGGLQRSVLSKVDPSGDILESTCHDLGQRHSGSTLGPRSQVLPARQHHGHNDMTMSEPRGRTTAGSIINRQPSSVRKRNVSHGSTARL